MKITRYFNNVDIESLIRTIRGQKVMIDFDLAMLYGVKNKAITLLRSQFATTKDLSKVRTLPYGVSAMIYTRYNEQFLTDLRKHNEQYPAIEFIQLPHKNHDRFLIIDEKVYSFVMSSEVETSHDNTLLSYLHPDLTLMSLPCKTTFLAQKC